jgi:hypothetical protein
MKSTQIIFMILSSLVWVAVAYSADVQLQWDANNESDLAGYKIYYKADSSAMPFNGTGATEGSSPIDVQNQTSATISGLDPAHAYYFAITAYNTSGIESGYSNIVFIAESAAPSILGDINGDGIIDILDVMLVLQISVGKLQPTYEEFVRGDVAPVINGLSVPNGKIDTGDAIVILSKLVGKIML